MKKIVFASILALAQLAFSADLTLAPGKQANINGTVVACKTDDNQSFRNFLNADDATLFVIALAGIGRCQVLKEQSEENSHNYYHYLRINGKRVYQLPETMINAKYHVVPVLRGLIATGACDL